VVFKNPLKNDMAIEFMHTIQMIKA